MTGASSTSDDNVSPLWVRWAVPGWMAIWALGHLIVVQASDLSTWRGGGFGMYASFHPVQHDGYVVLSDGSPLHFTKHATDPNTSETRHDTLYRILRSHLTFARPQRLQLELADWAKENGVSADATVTKLDFDLDTLQLSQQTVLNVETARTDEERRKESGAAE